MSVYGPLITAWNHYDIQCLKPTIIFCSPAEGLYQFTPFPRIVLHVVWTRDLPLRSTSVSVHIFTLRTSMMTIRPPLGLKPTVIDYEQIGHMKGFVMCVFFLLVNMLCVFDYVFFYWYLKKEMEIWPKKNGNGNGRENNGEINVFTKYIFYFLSFTQLVNKWKVFFIFLHLYLFSSKKSIESTLRFLSLNEALIVMCTY